MNRVKNTKNRPLFEVNPLGGAYGESNVHLGFSDTTSTALEVGKTSSEGLVGLSESALKAATAKQDIERMIELLGRKCSKIGPRAAQVLRDNLAKAEQAESSLAKAEMTLKVFKIAVAAKGFYDCYEEHCAKCLEKCRD